MENRCAAIAILFGFLTSPPVRSGALRQLCSVGYKMRPLFAQLSVAST
jgi:hypothetical protein